MPRISPALFASLFSWLILPVMASVETAPYQVVEKSGDFEIRDYPALPVVEAPMPGGSANGSFGRLFQFISGKNEGTEKIPMTAPVIMSHTENTMAFVMPANMPLTKVPAPGDKDLKVREIPAGRFAVYRFSGFRSDASEARALGKLRGFLRERGFTAAADPVFGYFDPPWTLPFLRRNEAMLRLTDR